MLIKLIDNKNILILVKKCVFCAKHEIISTMLLREEVKSPLPTSYFNLLRKKVMDKVILYRLGFGNRKDYVTINRRIGFSNQNYVFRYMGNSSSYQRMIIIDKKILFFGVEDLFFQSTHKPIIKAFSDYFFTYFRKGKL